VLYSLRCTYTYDFARRKVPGKFSDRDPVLPTE
jgi:hypothetical protein